MTQFDVIVVGGGHAGSEAAAAAARTGARVLLVTQRADRIGEMSCNPSIGGIGKGHLVREIDALDGLMGQAADRAGIHFKVLNSSKGPAVRGLRAQMDRTHYRNAIQSLLRETPGLVVREASVEDLETTSGGAFVAAVLGNGERVTAGACVLTTGTFLGGVIHVGNEQCPAGRVGEAPSLGLARTLGRLALPIGRLKTGTPPRLAKASIDWEALAADVGDAEPTPFSFMTRAVCLPQIPCRITATTSDAHAVVRDNLHRSAIYGGAITGRGPRYCPSIEDKIVRFPQKERHQIFLEPEGLPDGPDGETVYPNGISTSLPAEIQAAFIARIPGLERAQILRPGYAVEYDFVQPTALWPSLELRAVPGLFLAGQITGTTGYEEAAAQGVLAGINAARCAAREPSLILDRASSYLGVMVDDLTGKGVTEPYRMFTSRSEFRLSLRCDNADLRLTPVGIRTGCVGSAREAAFATYAGSCADALNRAKAETVPASALREAGVAVKQDGQTRSALEVINAMGRCGCAARFFPWLADLPPRIRIHMESEALYGGYLARQAAEARQLRAADAHVLPANLDYSRIRGLNTEAREKLAALQPGSVGSLSRIPGLSPAAIMAVIGHIRQLRQ